MDLWHKIAVLVALGLIFLFFGSFYAYFKYKGRTSVPYWYMRYATWCFDYVFYWWVLYCLDALIGHDNIFRYEPFLPVYIWVDSTKDVLIGVGFVLITFNLLFTGLATREFILCFLFRDKIAKVKYDFLMNKSWKTLSLYGWITLAELDGIVILGLLTICGFVYWHEILLDMRSYWTVIMEYHIMLVLKDQVSFHIIHRHIMHKWKWNLWHHIHHGYTFNTTTISASVMHPADVIVENVFGPIILLLLKFIVLSIYYGKPILPQVHFAAYLFVLLVDLSVHSANPYSVIFFNPIIDWIFLQTLGHNLHHMPKETRLKYGLEWDLQIPWNHLCWKNRRRDIEIYNEVFETEFTFDDAPAVCCQKVKQRISRLSRISQINEVQEVARDIAAHQSDSKKIGVETEL